MTLIYINTHRVLNNCEIQATEESDFGVQYCTFLQYIYFLHTIQCCFNKSEDDRGFEHIKNV